MNIPSRRDRHSRVALVSLFLLAVAIAAAQPPAHAASAPPAGRKSLELDSSGPVPFLPAAISSGVDAAALVAPGACTARHIVSLSTSGMVAMGCGATLVVLDNTNPSQPVTVGWLDMERPILDLAAFGRYVYVGADEPTLTVVDMLDPRTPVVVATHVWSNAFGATVAGESVAAQWVCTPVCVAHAIVGSSSTGIRLLDVTSPLAITTARTITDVKPIDLFSTGNLYALDQPTPGSTLMRVSAIDAPLEAPLVLRSTLIALGHTSPELSRLGGIGGRIFATDYWGQSLATIVDSGSGPLIYATSNAINGAYPTTVSASPGDFMTGSPASIHIGTEFGWKLYTMPTGGTVPSFQRETTIPGGATALAAQSGGKALFAGPRRYGLVDGASGSLAASSYALSDAPAIAAARQHVFVAAGPDGLLVYDVATPGRPRFVAQIPALSEQGTRGVAVSGIVLIVTDYAGVVRFYGIVNPAAPVLVSTYDIGDMAGIAAADATRVAIAGDVGGIPFVDVFATAAGLPTRVATLSPTRAPEALAVGSGSSVFVGDYAGLQVFDQSLPPGAAPIATASGYVRALAALGSRLYKGGATPQSFAILDVATPATPWFVGSWDIAFEIAGTMGSATGVAGLPPLAYVSGADGTHLLDIASPSLPTRLGYYRNAAGALATADGFVHVAGQSSGVRSLHFASQCWDAQEPNDLVSLATTMAASTTYTGKLCYESDVDYFKLTVPAGGTLRATLTPPAYTNYNLFLHDEALTQVAASTNPYDALETITKDVTSGGTYYLKVDAPAGIYTPSFEYLLDYTFTPCPAPTQAVYIQSATRDARGNIVLNILDGNQAATVTGYDIWRATTPSPGSWPVIASNVADMDAGAANKQFIDTASSGTVFYYKVVPVNATCGGVGPSGDPSP